MKIKLAPAIAHWWQSFEKYPLSSWGFSLVWLVLISWVAFLWHLGSTGLIDETEPLFAEAARQMTVTGDWITPYFNEITRFDKPPLIYWLMAIGYHLIGVNEWAVRLPSALAAIALTGLVFFTLRYFGFATPGAAGDSLIESRKSQRQLWIAAWIGAALAAFNVHTLAWSHQGVSDMLLSGCMGTALLCFFWGYATAEKEEKNTGDRKGFPNRWYWGFYILSGLAVLTKGPVGIVIPALIIITFLLYVGRWQEVLKEMGLLWGGLAFSAIVLPWYILVILKNGDAFINSFFGYHNVERFTQVVNGHSAVWYFYFLIVLGLFAPWSIYLPLGISRLRFWQRKFWVQQPRRAHLSLFALFWFVDIFVFFTIAVTKLPSYVLPLIPAAAILVALLWSEEFTRDSPVEKAVKRDWGLFISIIFNLLLVGILAIASLQMTHLIGRDAAMVNLSRSLDGAGVPSNGAIIWGTTAIIGLFFLFRRQQWRWILTVNIVGFLAFIIFAIGPSYFLVDRDRQLPLRELSEIVTQVRQPEEPLVAIGFKKPSIVFYTRQSTAFFWRLNDADGNAYLQELANTPDPSPTLLLIGQPDEIRASGLEPKDYRILGDRDPYRLVRVDWQKTIQP